jgi:hypothetical protein
MQTWTAGNREVQLQLFHDYPAQPGWVSHLSAVLPGAQTADAVVWGQNDEIFGPEGAGRS